ncbi:hypothetical protein WMY93_026960 [Mugilogobius chulae]|uniref:DDE Tnp4 domain-containing protein n=1 Tax=Mugilogobius chulae TaxID=88201 RepID=A0AAW0MVY0_9GOBI
MYTWTSGHRWSRAYGFTPSSRVASTSPSDVSREANVNTTSGGAVPTAPSPAVHRTPYGGMAADYLNRKLFHGILLQAICPPCIVIERVFDMMKGIFFKALEVNTIFVPKVVAVCTILHNLEVTNGDNDNPLPPHDFLPLEQENEVGGEKAVETNAALNKPPPLVCGDSKAQTVYYKRAVR